MRWFGGGSGAHGTGCYTVLTAASARCLVGLGIDKRLAAFENSNVHPGQVVDQRFRVIDIERRESIRCIAHVPKQLLRSALLGCRPAKQIQHFLLIPWKSYVLARVEETLLEGGRNIVVDVLDCSVTSTIIYVFGIHVHGLIAVASQLAVQPSHVVPTGRATSGQLGNNF